MLVNKDSQSLLDQVCTVIAYRVWSERRGTDTNPMVVEKLGEPVGRRWYYRSDQIVYDRSRASDMCGKSYVGPPEEASVDTYGSGTWRKDDEAGAGMRQLLEKFPDDLVHLESLEIPYD